MSTILGLLALAYPLILYAGFRAGYYATVGVVLVVCLALRVYLMTRRYCSRTSVKQVVVVALIVCVVAALHSTGMVLWWPAFISSSLCVIFTASFFTHTTIIERIAARAEGPLSPQARRYCEQVTKVWTIFFAVNACIALDSVFRSIEWWALYNGIISYCLIAALFVGELLIRVRVKKRLAKTAQALCLVALSCGMAASALAEPAPPQRQVDIESIKRSLVPPGPFRVEFTETRFVAVLSGPLESRGTIRCLPDAGLVWEVSEPVARTSIITPRAIVEVVGQRTVSTTVDVTQISKAMLSLMSGAIDAISSRFDVAIAGSAATWKVRLAPRDSLVRGVVGSIIVEGSNRPKRIEVRHASGDRVVTKFSEPTLLTASEIEGVREALRRAS